MRENDRDKFVRLANKRVNSALKAIQIIGNLSNRSNYDYTEDDVDQIFTTLNREIRESKDLFKSNGTSKKPNFELK